MEEMKKHKTIASPGKKKIKTKNLNNLKTKNDIILMKNLQMQAKNKLFYKFYNRIMEIRVKYF
jgi:hypothetical protein